jgi:inner membrane protein
MDPVTHGLVGATIYNLGFKRKAAFWVLLIASVAPDLDYVTRLWGTDILLRYHRGITHGILALFMVPIIIGMVFGYRKGFIYYTFLAFIAYAAHLILDLTNQYGTRILSPLDWNQYSLDLVFIFDPYITGGLLLSLIICRINRKKTAVIALITVLLLVSYAGGRFYLHGKIKEFLRSKMDANTYMVCPLPNDFLRWWFIVKSGNEIKVGFADLFTQRVCEQETYTVSEKDPFITMSKETRVVENFLYFARYPYAEVQRDPGRITVLWRELAYSFLPGDHFVAVVIFGSDGKVVHSYFTF